MPSPNMRELKVAIPLFESRVSGRHLHLFGRECMELELLCILHTARTRISYTTLASPLSVFHAIISQVANIGTNLRPRSASRDLRASFRSPGKNGMSVPHTVCIFVRAFRKRHLSAASFSCCKQIPSSCCDETLIIEWQRCRLTIRRQLADANSEPKHGSYRE